MLLAAFPADNVQHFLDPLILELKEAVRACSERCGSGKKGRIHIVSNLGNEAVNGKRVILEVFPWHSRKKVSQFAGEFIPASV